MNELFLLLVVVGIIVYWKKREGINVSIRNWVERMRYKW